MLAEKKRDTNIGVGVGILLQLIGRVMQFQGASGLGFVLVLAGLAVFVWGCVSYCQGKGYPGWLGLLGLLSIIGLLILVFLPDRNKHTT